MSRSYGEIVEMIAELNADYLALDCSMQPELKGRTVQLVSPKIDVMSPEQFTQDIADSAMARASN